MKLVVQYNRTQEVEYKIGDIIFLFGHVGLRLTKIGKAVDLSILISEVTVEGDLFFRRT